MTGPGSSRYNGAAKSSEGLAQLFRRSEKAKVKRFLISFANIISNCFLLLCSSLREIEIKFGISSISRDEKCKIENYNKAEC